MKIGIIIEPYEEKNASGIAHCILNQARGLMALDRGNQYIIYTSKPFKKERLTPNAQNVLIPSSFLGKNLWFVKQVLFAKSHAPDVLIFNMPLLPLVVPKGIATTPVFYELMYTAPKNLSFKRRILMAVQKFFIATSLKRAERIITPSNSTREDVIQYYGIPEKKVQTIYLGFQKLESSGDDAPLDNIDAPYFLFMGKVKFKKNVHNILEGFILFKKKHNTNHKLYLAGDYGGKYYDDLMRRITEEAMEKDVIFGGYKYGNDIYRLYKNTEALMFCTLQEGFGMPVIEAMDIGAPVITSDRPPLNEIGKDCSVLVDPEDAQDIANAMSRVVFEDGFRADLITKGRENAKKFSWEKHNKELLDILTTIQEHLNK